MSLRSGRDYKMAQKPTGSQVPEHEESQPLTNVGDSTNVLSTADMMAQIMQMIQLTQQQTVDQIKQTQEQTTEQIRQTTAEIQRHTADQIANHTLELGQKFETFKEEIKEDIQRQIQTVKMGILQEVRTHIEHEYQTLTEKVDRRDIIYEERLTQHDQRLDEITQSTQTLQTQIAKNTHTPTYITRPEIATAISDLKFFGDSRVHPCTFITRLQNHIATLAGESDIKSVIQSCLKGNAELWYNIIEERYCTMGEFTELFLRQYWGEYVQQKVRLNLFNGKYSESFGCSREQYFIRKYNTIRHLEPHLTEAEIVKYIAHHFEDDVNKVIITQRITTIENLLDYLRAIDDGRAGWRNRSPREQSNQQRAYNPRGNFENRHNNNNRQTQNHNSYNRENRENNANYRYNARESYNRERQHFNNRDNNNSGERYNDRDRAQEQKKHVNFLTTQQETDRQTYSQVINRNNGNKNLSQEHFNEITVVDMEPERKQNF